MRGTSMLLWSVLGLLFVAGLTPMAGVTAQTEPAAVTVVGTEGPDCPIPEQKLYCLMVSEGSLEDLAPGQQVELTLVNDGQFPHNAYFTTPDQADESREDTPSDAAFANTTTIESGGETNITFTIPEDASALYVWCDVGNHEQMGMWLEVELSGAGNATDEDGDAGGDQGGNATNGEGDGDDEQGVPVPAWSAPAALLLSALVLLDRRGQR